MNEKMNSRQASEHGGKVSRRSTRTFVEEEQQQQQKNGQESRTSSGDEMDVEMVKGGGEFRATNVAVVFRPVAVDLGMDVTDLFPARLEDRDKQVLAVLQGAKASTKSKTDERPINFGKVIPGVYRSSFPGEEDFNYLKTLGLKTVLSLVKKDFPPEFEAFMKQNGIRHYVIDMQGTKKVDIPEEIMNSIMEIVLEKKNHPLLIHCNHGKHRTGCAVAVMRHVAGWNIDSIIQEYQGFAAPKIRDCDVSYITQYKVSSLEGLFLRRAQRLRIAKKPSPNERMLKFLMLTAIILSIWFTTFLIW
ncbi:uncharacterized protein LY89DRAFT_221848 [Mollisia scopiformis]|uniref:diphosphoinositol-polyphosphate diphosphatase n=1 Tax=Mollisia scopiformis TaxID=149040 RepID=A0A194WWN3_MOLSC|nr:uncharacterized protein LY89DRAFT_221848 [Mollisia scopiformis]KUJ12094.1 hypothetical protein LY89DRAFT_221848 [Mollisia scopiformis]